MKKYLSGIMAIVIVLSACKKDAVKKPSDNGKTPVTFNVGYTQSTGGFNGAANISQSKFGAHTLAADTALTNYASVIIAGLYSSDGTLISFTNQVSTDADFGQISYNLSPGDYTITFAAGQPGMAETGTSLSNTDLRYTVLLNNSPVYTWGSTFLQTTNITVGSQGITQSVALNRIDSEVVLNIEDAVPANVKYIYFQVSDDYPYSELNVGTGVSEKNFGVGRPIAYTSPVTAITPGTTNLRLVLPILGHTSNENITFNVYAFDQLPQKYPGGLSAQGHLITSYGSGITIQTGHQTILSGNLFGGNGLTNTGGFQMTIDPEWSTVTTTVPFQ